MKQVVTTVRPRSLVASQEMLEARHEALVAQLGGLLAGAAAYPFSNWAWNLVEFPDYSHAVATVGCYFEYLWSYTQLLISNAISTCAMKFAAQCIEIMDCGPCRPKLWAQTD